MPDSLLTGSQKEIIKKSVKSGSFKKIISILESVKTTHAGTAKTKDKRFVIEELVTHIKSSASSEKELNKKYFDSAVQFCGMKEDVAKQIGASLLWRGFKHNKQKAKKLLLDIADHANWEVRESAGGAFANTLSNNPGFYTTLLKWTNHRSENVRRAVLFGALGIWDKREDADVKKAFRLLEPLMYDSSPYVKKNLGPFILGSYFGNAFPNETLKQLDKWVKIKDENVRWNVAMAFNNSFGNKYPQKALKYLRTLSKDPNLIVQRAVRSTLNHLRKRHNNLEI